MSTNPYRDSSSGDYLNKVKQHMLENRAGNTSAGTYTPNYIIPVPESVTTSDTATVDPNKQTVSENITTSDTATATGYTTFNFTNTTESSGNLRWSFGSFTNSTGGFT